MTSGVVGPVDAEGTIREAAPGLARSRVRRRLRLGALAALAYAVAVLIIAARSGSPGFASIYGGRVLTVEAGSAAEAAGVRVGDLVMAVNGKTTTNALARDIATHSLPAGSLVHLRVLRDGHLVDLAYRIPRRLPVGSAAGTALAAALLALALISDRGGPRSPTRSFFRSSIVYVVFLAGTFSWEAVLGHPFLAIPWIIAVCLAAPVTCHFMLQFPAGPTELPRKQVLWLYVPPLLIAAFHLWNLFMFVLGFDGGIAAGGSLYGGAALAIAGAVYLTVGAVARARRLRAKRAEIDPVALRVLHIGGVVIAAPLVVGTVVMFGDPAAFIGGGFRPYVAMAMVGGSICVVIAQARSTFGDLDRALRKGTGQVVGSAVAAAIYLGVVTVVGSTSVLHEMGSVPAAVAATVLAAIVFGPVRSRTQHLVDSRFVEDRARARLMLRDAAEVALRTLDVEVLQEGVVTRVRAALSADGVALYEALPPSEGGWRLAAEAGSNGLVGSELARRDPLTAKLDAAIASGEIKEIATHLLGVPIPLSKPPAAALVVAPAATRPLDEEDCDLLTTLAAGLAVAVANARAHTDLQSLSKRLESEVQVAERRRREIARLKERIEEEKQVLEAELARRGGRMPVIGAGLRPTFELVQKVAKSEITVLVSGETGVGKELAARAIHAASARRAGPFVVVDCASIPAGLAESTLFGHERGAFTGATRASQGAFRAAHGGTIFLDEIGELPMDLQPKLLRVLQEREVRPVGAEATIPVDVRVVAGTNRDLGAEVAAGRFREDLLYRLRVVEITVPPLRSRKRDIPELAEHFLRTIAERKGQAPKRLSPDAVAALLDHDWPGNVRELEHTLEAAVVAAEGEEITATNLRVQESTFRRRAERAVANAGDGGPGLRETLEHLERERTLDTLRQCKGNRSAAAKALGMSRGALLRRLARWGIEE